jgi:hypothetical protein
MTAQPTDAAKFSEDYLRNHPEMLEVYVQGPNGKDLFRPGQSADLTSSEYGPVDMAYLVHLADKKVRVYGTASSVSGEYGKYEIKFDAGVLQVYGFKGNLIAAYAPGQWNEITGSEWN